MRLGQIAQNARQFPIALVLFVSACAVQPSDVVPSAATLSPTGIVAVAATVAPRPTATSQQPTVISREPTLPPEHSLTTQSTPAGPVDRWTDIRMTLQALTECTDDTLLSVLPLIPEDNALMVPLGTLGPPGHTLPGNFILYFLRGHETGSTAATDVWAPGNIRTLTVESTIGRKDGQEVSADYGITFAPCRDRMFNLDHLSSLDSVLIAAIDATEPDFCNHEFQFNDVTYQYCSYRIGLELAAGT